MRNGADNPYPYGFELISSSEKAITNESEVPDDLMVSVALGSNTGHRSQEVVFAKKRASQSYFFEGEKVTSGKGGPENPFSSNSASANAISFDWSISEEMVLPSKMSMEGDTVLSKCEPKQTHIHDIKLQWRKAQISRQQQNLQEKKVTWWTWLRSISPSIAISSPKAQELTAGEKYIGMSDAFSVGNRSNQQAMRSKRASI
jgi:hypothetical protein